MKTPARKPLTNEELLKMLGEEIVKHGVGMWGSRRRTIEEMLRMRGVKLA